MKFGASGRRADSNDKREPCIREPEPVGPTNPFTIDRYCDLVLTGGVADGVVYPWAIVELARVYRFRSIGGTSVGAVAAALAAAAEYGRRFGTLDGFNKVLLKMPSKLSEEQDCKGTTKLFTLFQPARSTKRLFDLFVAIFAGSAKSSETTGIWGKIASWASGLFDCVLQTMGKNGKKAGTQSILNIIITICRIYWKPGWMGGLFGIAISIGFYLLVFVISDWLSLIVTYVWCVVVNDETFLEKWNIWEGLAAFGPVLLWTIVPAFLVGFVVKVLCALYRDFVDGLVKNKYGMCKGCRSEITPRDQQALVEWLHEGIQGAANKPLDQPLTFRDLWDAPGGPPASPEEENAMLSTVSRSIDLRMITTNVTHGRPYELPLTDEINKLFFKRDELEGYFPKTVLDHLDAHSDPYNAVGYPFFGIEPAPFRGLPIEDLPIVVASRMSLSFPVLFSAVPFWAIEYRAKTQTRIGMKKCWFSDGGITSNFPIHMFDAAIPQWPTFGISLQTASKGWPEPTVWLPEFHYQGLVDSWDKFDEEKSKEGQLLGFVHSLIEAAKDWNDTVTMRMPGVRDRVVNIALHESSGGLNLKLAGRDIMKFAADGQQAGIELVKKFIDRGSHSTPSVGWNEHRWVRFNVMLVALRERVKGLAVSADQTLYATPISGQIGEARLRSPLRRETVAVEPIFRGKYDDTRLTHIEADALERLLCALKEFEAKFARAAATQPYRAIPPPSLRIRPPV